MTAKNAPYPACHRDYFSAKATGQVTGWLRRVTQPPHIAGPLWAIDFLPNRSKTKERNTRMKLQESKFEKIYIPDGSAGLARSHRHIRIEREKELIFLKLCSKIRLDDFKKDRTNEQRESRKLKRQNQHCNS